MTSPLAAKLWTACVDCWDERERASSNVGLWQWLYTREAFEALAKEIDDSPALAPVIGKLVGHGEGAAVAEGSRIAATLLSRLAPWEALPTHDVLRSAVDRLLQEATSDSVEVEHSAVVVGLRLDADEVSLGQDLAIKRSDRGNRHDWRDLRSRTHRLTMLRTFPRLVGDQPISAWASEELARGSRRLQSAVVALQLATGGSCGIEWIETRETGFIASMAYATSSHDILHPSPTANLSLSADAAASARTIYAHLTDEAVSKDHALEVALRRFADAKNRPRTDDRLIDLMIAAEALFLQDDGSELSYRLALRASAFLGEGPEHRRLIFNTFRELYSLRSRAVHGTRLSAVQQQELGRLLPLGEGLLGQALRSACELVATNQRGFLDQMRGRWDDLIVGPGLP